ncbi:hypothetical protein NC651_018157 [Populus alba x Populus x berolinensis]|nr:hypothetical protein NC651_018157 [Populus alba x Populus x berolinensis]
MVGKNFAFRVTLGQTKIVLYIYILPYSRQEREAFNCLEKLNGSNGTRSQAQCLSLYVIRRELIEFLFFLCISMFYLRTRHIPSLWQSNNSLYVPTWYHFAKCPRKRKNIKFLSREINGPFRDIDVPGPAPVKEKLIK